MGKSTINGHVQKKYVSLPEGTCRVQTWVCIQTSQCSCLASTFVWMDLPAFYLGSQGCWQHPDSKESWRSTKTSPRLNWALQAIHHVPSSNRSNVKQWKMPLGRAIQNIPIPSHEIPVGWKRFPNPVGEFTISKELGSISPYFITNRP